MARSNRDEFSASTKHLLAKRVGYRCSFPDCSRITIGPGSETEDDIASIGQACHIASAAPGGKRYDSSMTSPQRSAYANGIWMCYTHAKLIDTDEARYTVLTLQQWKRDTEARALRNLESGVETMSFIQWRFQVNERLLQTLADPLASRTRLGQVINVGKRPDFYVPRQHLNQVLSHWWETVSTSHRGMAILGPEGHGKTWGVAHWVHQLLEQEEPPAVLFFGSITVPPIEPEAMIEKACRFCPESVEWRRWFLDKEPQRPVILIIFDGINENSNYPWGRVFNSLQLEAWPQRIAWITTCRPPDWHRNADRDLEVQTFDLAGYDDGELANALAAHQLNKEDLPSFVVESNLIRIPRLFDLVLKHRQTLEESGDMTEVRLIYEEFKDLLDRKDSHKMGFSDVDYKLYLKTFVKRMRPTYQDLVARDLPRPFFKDDTSLKVMEELISRGVMTQTNGKYRVDKDRMMLGSGLLLVDYLEEASSEHPTQSIFQFFDPLNDLDLKRDIVGFAAYHSLVDIRISSKVRMALFSVWMEARNWDTDLVNNFSAYYSINPEFYFDFFEAASDSDFRATLKLSWLARYVLINHKDAANSLTLYAQRFEKWCGYVDITGRYGLLGSSQGEREVRYRQKLGNLLGLTIQPGSVQVGDHTLVLTEKEGDMGLAETALEVISHMDRAPFTHCMVITALAERLMHRPTRQGTLQWVIRAAACDLESVLSPAIENLLALDHPFAACAASELLAALGSESSYAAYDRLPKTSLNPFEWSRPTGSNDPCKTFYLWTEAEFTTCVGRTDLGVEYICKKLGDQRFNPTLKIPTLTIQRLGKAVAEIDVEKLWTNRSRTSDDINLEDLTPLLARFAPEAFQSMVDRLMADIANREGEVLVAWCWSLPKYAFLIGDRHHEVLNAKWRHALDALRREEKTKNSNMKPVEIALLMRILALESDGQKQLDLLLERPKQAYPISDSHTAYLHPVEENSLLLDRLRSYTSTHHLVAILCFCYANPEDLSRPVLEEIFKKARENTDLTFIGFKVLNRCKNTIAKKFLITDALKSGDEEPSWKDWQGSLLLVENTIDLPVIEIFKRIAPQYSGLIVEIRQQREDLRLFVDHLEKVIKDGFRHYVDAPYSGGLLEAFQFKPSLIDRCIEKLDQKPSAVISLKPWYNVLVHAALEADFERGIKLFQTTKIAMATYNINFDRSQILFSVKSGDQRLDQLKAQLLTEANLDSQLLNYVFAAYEAGHQAWLWKEASKLLASSVPFERGRGLTLLGFFHHHADAEGILHNWAKKPRSWMHQIAKRAMKHYQKNQWAQHWFKQFVRATDQKTAWAGFTLFRSVVDSRFYLWQKFFSQDLEQNRPRFAFVKESWRRIDKAIEEHEKPLKETLFGHKIAKGELALWRQDI